MDNIKITPNKLKGKVNIPPSKSMAHRAIICAALSKGKSVIDNIELSDDIIATISAVKSMGAKVTTDNRKVTIEGILNSPKESDFTVDCNESGSTLRFFVPITMLLKGEKTFIGKGNLGKRPLDVFYNIFDKQGIEYYYEKDILNLTVDGRLKADTFEVRGDISSQFITGLLFTLPLLEGDSKIVITTDLESKSYLDLTLSMLEKFGIKIINNDYKEFIIKGNQEYKAMDYTVEGDYSQAAFFLSANYLGSDIDVLGLDDTSLQGDKEIIKWIDVLNSSEEKVIDAANCPDIIPVLTVCAALTKGETRIINAGRLRIKECDRLNAISKELSKLGAKIIENEDNLVIEGVESLKGGIVDSHKDHRISMSMAIASTAAKDDIIIKDYMCVRKSYPTFFEDFVSLGGEIHECDIWR
ncbi:3-phosphoshikimate 1-carboxyvinyltransferase [Anaerofustis stercorihominis]|uniref:3-phosphoshikimate 1-carboxyvinyltransferase n=2 Tax=Anaerofustis stercorihominis TaxID=214853 RepID=B1C7Z1_9FIRM|nr:3-phosphoshikimate 1-carboxyvinyltransferase [Anaerofustis stercorihominis]EDS73128.1 3-phosphoshikimate 1-carboxyvinyltransferase [Anaerofustis stercorihominis DSM 17244]MCQ4794438.1 3-phosphoshikimate 1-carboxyvinyltransferase [Anaerofustis stercorihominis]RGD74333.1 3-phosphoshikimate 1-carboxyvinyltransferase [Anaerofustis stercorihominis]